MNITARFVEKPPEEIEGIDRLRIEHKGMIIEIVACPAGLRVRLDEPTFGRFSVRPEASNTIVLSTWDRDSK